MLRGGACGDIAANARCTSRSHVPQTKMSGAIGFRCAASVGRELTRQGSAEEVAEARRFRRGRKRIASAQWVVGTMIAGLSVLVATRSWWLAAFAAYLGGVCSAGIGFILMKRNRWGARLAFEAMNLAPQVLVCVGAEALWRLSWLSVVLGFFAGFWISRPLLQSVFPDIYDEYEIKPARR